MRPQSRLTLALAASALLHALLLLAMPRPSPPLLRAGPKEGERGPLVVELVAPAPAPAPPPAPVPREPAAKPAPARPAPPPKRTITARRDTKPAPFAVPAPPPRPARPPPAPPPPAADMQALVNARRARRQAEEREAASAPGSPYRLPPPTEEERANAAIERNLRSLSGDDGTGGVFQILEKGTRTAEFAFNGWRAETGRRWREVIEVDAGEGGDIDLAIVRRMIALIRTHYDGDFRWESRRLGKVVVLSARPEDNAQLEQFLLREFFGTPTLKPALR